MTEAPDERPALSVPSNHPGTRIAAPSSSEPRRIGLKRKWHRDLYHRALTWPWWGFLLLVVAVFLAINVVFAVLYLLQQGAISNAAPGSLLDAFFFSVETFATIGYGVLAPATVYANTLMTAEAICGLLFVALTTGMLFARVSRPTARVLFSRVAVVSPFNGRPTLMVRMGNERTSQILQAEVTMTLVRNEVTREGDSIRRFYDLPLSRSRTPLFALSFLAMHPIDTASPLCGCSPEGLEAIEAEILVTVAGLDETSGQTVHARHSYLPSAIRFGYRYVDVFRYWRRRPPRARLSSLPRRRAHARRSDSLRSFRGSRHGWPFAGSR